VTSEDETGVADLVTWSKVFEANRRTFLGTSMIAVRGRIQREGDVVHLVVQKVTDLSADTTGERRPRAPRAATAYTRDLA
jgi:error-prone DNA polymerase